MSNIRNAVWDVARSVGIIVRDAARDVVYHAVWDAARVPVRDVARSVDNAVWDIMKDLTR